MREDLFFVLEARWLGGRLRDSMVVVIFELDDFAIHRGRVCEKG